MIAKTSGIHPEEGASLITLEVNTKGRDYFVGDLHGEGRLLQVGLKAANFDWSVDRLIAVGDLVNRGRSHITLFNTILTQPHFYSVLGNHDVYCWSQLQTYFNDGTKPKDPDLEWLYDFKPDNWQAFRAFFRRLPLAIRLTLSNGQRVGIIHADVPPEMKSFDELASISRDYLPTLTAQSKINWLLLGRRRFLAAEAILMATSIKGRSPDAPSTECLIDAGNDLDQIICGHSVFPSQLPVQAGKWTFLDTGAGRSNLSMPCGALTIFDPVGRRFIQTSHAEYGTVSVSELSLDDLPSIGPKV